MAPAPATIVASLRESIGATPNCRVYGVVDAANCVDLAYAAKILFGKEIRSLFRAEVQTQLWDVAPYLVPVDLPSDYLEHWARRWGTNAGVLLTTRKDEDALYEHLRKIFVVEDEEKQEYFFRFYDPRVLRSFLPLCTAEQLEEFFGPIESIVFEGEQSGTLWKTRREARRLVVNSVSLDIASREEND